jgi:hypothetical protein
MCSVGRFLFVCLFVCFFAREAEASLSCSRVCCVPLGVGVCVCVCVCVHRVSLRPYRIVSHRISYVRVCVCVCYMMPQGKRTEFTNAEVWEMVKFAEKTPQYAPEARKLWEIAISQGVGACFVLFCFSVCAFSSLFSCVAD